MNAIDVESDLQRGLRALVIATVTLYIVLLVVGIYFFVDSSNRRTELEEVARSTNGALCSLRADMERRVAASEDFLKDNPNGIPGISNEDIQTALANQKRTIDALGNLDCARLREEQ